jgi:hypothetical protein
VRLAGQPDQHGGVGTGVLDGILEGLDAAVVDAALDLFGVPPEPAGLNDDGSRCVPRDRLEAFDDAGPQQQLRAAVAGDVPDVGEGGVEVQPELVDRQALAVGGRILGEQAHVDADAHEPLLGAVVKVALDAFAFEVHRVEGPDPGPAEVAFEREALDPQPDEPSDRQRKRQELERRLVEDGEERERHGDEDDRPDDQRPPERAQRAPNGDERPRQCVTLVGVGPAADEHAFLPARDGSGGRRTGLAPVPRRSRRQSRDAR